MDCTRGVWEISEPTVKGGEVSEQSPLLPASLHMARKSQGQGKETQACSEEFSSIEEGITLGYRQS